MDFKQVEHLIQVGTHHAKKLYKAAKSIGSPATYISTHHQDNNTINKTAKQISNNVQNLSRRSEKFLAVYHIYDNSTYRDSAGNMSVRGAHIRGPILHPHHSSILRWAVEESLPLLDAASPATEVHHRPLLQRPCSRHKH